MKIIFYSAHPALALNAPTGYGRHMRGVIYGLRELGHEVIPCVAGGVGEYSEVTTSDGLSQPKSFKAKLKKFMPKLMWETIKDLKLILDDRKYAATLDELVAKEKPDLIYDRINYLQVSGVKVAKKYGIKHISEINAPYTEERIELQGKSLLLKRAEKYERYVIEKSNLIVVVSTALKNYFSKKYPVLRDTNKCLVVSNAVEKTGVTINGPYVSDFKNKHSLNGNIIIGFVGSILNWHGIGALLEGFKLFAEDKSDVKLLVVGDGQQLNYYKQKAIDLGINEQVIFTGNVAPENVPSLIELMDVTVMVKSNWYGSPVKIFEYARQAKAMVLANTEPIAETFKHEKEALLINSTPREINEAFIRLHNNLELANELGENARLVLIEKHTWESKCAILIDTIK